MIVKDEAHVIRRCLDSVRPLVDYVLVEDTGSTDGTQDIIRAWLQEHGIAGEVVEEAWRDFAFNRTHALSCLRRHADIDYALIIDADDTLEYEPGFDPAAFKASMSADLYDVVIRYGNIRYSRPQMVRNARQFSYRGVLHEFIEVPPGAQGRATAEGFAMRINGGGARSQDPEKFVRDARILARALAGESDPFLRSRYTFYLAQSYRDCGEREKALEHYLARAQMGFWQEEVFVALYRAAKLKEALGHPEEEVIAAYLRASEAQPTRGEALHGASRFCRYKGRNKEGAEIARRGIDLPMPERGLFIEPWIYQWGLLDEFAINAYWSGDHQGCLDASLRMLATEVLDEATRRRATANARFASDRLREGLAVIRQEMAAARIEHAKASTNSAVPRVLLAILAKNKEGHLPLFLSCIEALDYPTDRICLYVRTNNNTDSTAKILKEWLGRVGNRYFHVEFDDSDVAERVQDFGEHEWNATRFLVLGRIRQHSMERALALQCGFYFVVDVDNFIRPPTLRRLVEMNLPIVAPLLRCVDADRPRYSNFHHRVDKNGYFLPSEEYGHILDRTAPGLHEVAVVHCTYLVRADAIPSLTYDDRSARYEYVIFSDSARRAGIPQMLDTREIYGWLTFAADDVPVRHLMMSSPPNQISSGSEPGKTSDGHTSVSLSLFKGIRPAIKSKEKKLIVSPQAGFGNRLRTLCAAKILGMMTGRTVYHFWVKDPELSHVEHVNYLKNIEPSHFFDLKIPLFEGDRVDVCFTEWMPGDFWHSQQATAQHRLQYGRCIRIQDPSEIAMCTDDVILVETSLELHLPQAMELRHSLMGEIYRDYFPLNKRWKSLLEGVPQFDNGISIRRGNFMQYNPDADIKIDRMCALIENMRGSKIIFSDDEDYIDEVRFLTNCPLGISGITKNLSPIDYAFMQFLVLSKCQKIFGTRNSSFPEQAAIYGRRKYEEI